MSSSLIDRADTAGRRSTFLSADRGSVARLIVVLALGAAALAGPLVGSTTAQFTDSTQVEMTISVPAPPLPLPDPAPGP